MGHEYTINRVKVLFPHKAYPSQVAMMSQIIRALQRGQNALLESPTGSGKSLALLCAALAWQREEARKAREYNAAVEEGALDPEFVYVDENDEEVDAKNVKPAPDGGFMVADGDDGDFEDDFGQRSPPRKKNKLQDDQQQDPHAPLPRLNYGLAGGARSKPVAKQVKKMKVPKIYFGTRTHKQIAQIIRELNKTSYKDTKMSILGSREHTCVHPTVSRLKNKNEGCRELTDRKKGMGCSFMSNVKNKLSTHAAVSAYRGGVKEAWDLEDLVKVGKKVRACPYYASRELMNKSDIVFCPYNYLIEPLIRKSLEINLKGQVLILDEAHNIEDSARSAASWQVTQEALIESMRDLEKVSAAGVAAESHREMATLCSQLSTWMDSCKDSLLDYQDFNSSSKIWTGNEILAVFETMGVGQSRFDFLHSHMQKVMEEWMANKEEDGRGGDGVPEVPVVSAGTMDVLEGFFLVLNYLLIHGMRHRDDYRVALTKSQTRGRSDNQDASATAVSKPGLFGMWLGKGKSSRGANTYTPPKFQQTLTLNFWCLNPAVSFLELKDALHSVVLTSGTLSPMASFSTELDVRFQNRLEANHVIDRRQVWIGTLSRGPNGHSLNATFRSAETFQFQDEVGNLVAEVCETMPHGVLLFLPSYSMMNKLCERWESTGLWERLKKKKAVIKEPRFSDEFEESIRHFGNVIVETNDKVDVDGMDGALFIAVCRGKVSEGMDFADNNARAVICVGIPFPNFKDVQVDLKKKYNDGRRRANSSSAQLLSGNEWYEIQAFRALNQALGRCIRHRQDWGAILMVDDRYQREGSGHRYIGGLSKWVRAGVRHYKHFQDMAGSLTEFRTDMRRMEVEAKELEEKSPAEETTNKEESKENSFPEMCNDKQAQAKDEKSIAEDVRFNNDIDKNIIRKDADNCKPPVVDLTCSPSREKKEPLPREDQDLFAAEHTSFGKSEVVEKEHDITVVPESPDGSEDESTTNASTPSTSIKQQSQSKYTPNLTKGRGKVTIAKKGSKKTSSMKQGTLKRWAKGAQYITDDDNDFV